MPGLRLLLLVGPTVLGLGLDVLALPFKLTPQVLNVR